MCQACNQDNLAYVVPGQDSAILVNPRLMASARIAVSNSVLSLAASPLLMWVKRSVKPRSGRLSRSGLGLLPFWPESGSDIDEHKGRYVDSTRQGAAWGGSMSAKLLN